MRDSAPLRWLRSKTALPAVVAIACLLCAPGLWGGFSADDLLHRKFVLEHLSGHGTSIEVAWWNMFDQGGRTGVNDIAVRIATGVLPWWASPQLKVAFLRPLAVVSHYFDFMVWPDAAWLMHLHNIALYATCVGLAAALYRRLLGARALAGLAALLYAIDEAHADGTAWLADRNTLLTALFALLTVWLFDRARREGARAAQWLAPAALLCAHASSEGAIAVWAYLAAYALCIDRAPLRARLVALAPLLAVTLCWVAWSTAHGFGVRASGIYVDPRSDPRYFFEVTAERLPEVLRAQFTLPFEIERRLPYGAQRWSVLGSYLLLALIGVALAPLVRRSATARFFALGALGSALPVCAGGAEPRLLFLVGFGAHGLLAELIGACVRALPGAAPARRVLPALVACACVVLHGPLAAITAPLTPRIWIGIHRQLRRIADTLPTGRDPQQTVLIVLNTNYYLAALFVRLYGMSAGEAPAMMHVLSASLTPVRLTRLERNAFELEPQGGFLLEPTSKLVRSPTEAFRVGQVISLFGPRITVEEITADGRPKRIRAELLDVDDERLVWVTWNDRRERYERVSLPPIGTSLLLPGSTGPPPG